ncbi:MAG: response regulator [Verrucomicrobiales bacterium]|nr:response regulator [Verrucomicrobiales bacterium]
MRVIIVDDEPLARDRLRSLLSKESDIQIVAECGDGREAVSAVQRENPDVLFLDIQMPELDGFGVLAQLRSGRMPLVVFVTAFDEFAVKAFEFHAFDYLLKPFDKDRLKSAVARIRETLAPKATPTTDLSDRLTALLETIQSGTGPDRIAVKLDGRVIFLRPTDIDWIEAQDNYVKLHVGREAHLVRDTISNFETRLDGKRFIRIARSTIVNIDRVREMQPMFHGEYVVILQDGSKLTMSRGYRETLQHYLGAK